MKFTKGQRLQSRAKLATVPPRILVRIVMWLHRILSRMANSLVPPQVVLFDQIGGMGITICLHVAARFRIADHLAKGRMTAQELASLTGSHSEALHRTLRGLATVGIFRLHSDGRFSNNRLSEVLQSDAEGSLRAFAEFFGTRSNVEAWMDLETTVRTGKSAFIRVHERSYWDWIKEHPEEGRIFAGAMDDLSRMQAPAIATAYPFGRFESLCDVAGGCGTVLVEILSRHPKLKAALFEVEELREQARLYLEKKGLPGKVNFLAGNFFEVLPHGFSAYFLKDILHDWDDVEALKILQAVRKAMPACASLLVAEVLVEANESHKPGPLMDLQMMVGLNDGRQRSVVDFERLFAASGFQLQGVVPTALPISIVEATVKE